MTNYDALVIGGGPAGSTAALLLAQTGWSVLLVESKAFPRRKVCGEFLSATNWPLLRRLGVFDAFLEMAGPEVRRAAIFAGSKSVEADLPQPRSASEPFGRALSREHLDLLLLQRAQACGAEVVQPAKCMSVERCGNFECQIELASGETTTARSPIVIAAHGSWEIGDIASQRRPAPNKPGDWLAFKAHFRGASLAAGLMPLLSFVDGYGGMTHCDDGLVSLSCCIRRSRLQTLARSSGESAGDAVLKHILASSPVVEPVLAGAKLEGPWLAAGPIQPGIRPRCRDGIFVVGNAAGEAHPVVAEGISMAMQSAWLLCERLLTAKPQRISDDQRQTIAAGYSADWRRAFAPRIRAASAIAHWAMRPALVAATLPFLRTFPSLLTFGAKLSGKATIVVETKIAAATVG